MDDFGGKLRQARERRGISLRQIAASTKISAAALEALERNDISKLPGGIFSRAFVRSYATEVGLDPDDTVREFLERFNQEPAPTAEAVAAAIPEEEREFKERQRKAAKIAIAGAAVIVLILAALVMAYRARAAARAREQEPIAKDSTPASAPETPAAAPAPPQPLPAVETPPPQPAQTKAAPVAPPAAQVKLEIAPTADCWVSVTVDGKKLFARVMPAGEKQSFAVTKDATVEVGDAGAFAYSINGKPGKSLGDTGQVRTLKLTPATAAQYTR
jgi:cytoskeleton protein RodZ